MADNTKSEQGRESLSKALESHGDSIFNRIEDVVSPEVDTKGLGILEHILGDKVGMLAEFLICYRVRKRHLEII